MLARRLTTMLPAMTLAEAFETTRIHRWFPAVGMALHARREPIPAHLSHPDHLFQSSCPRKVWPDDPAMIHADVPRVHERGRVPRGAGRRRGG
jgi:hypothetical protein